MHIETFIAWLQGLFTAIDLALPLDERHLPRDQTVPRFRRRGTRRDLTPEERQAQFVQEQMTLIERHYPHLAVLHGASETPAPTSRPRSAPSSSRTRTRPDRRRSSSPRQTPSEDTEIPTRQRAVSEPAVSPFTEDGKWRPQHQWSSRYDLMYARKCMAVLTSRAPHKSNTVILKGKAWHCDWATGDLTSLEPPQYDEIDDAAASHLRAGRFGNVVRVV